MQKDVSPMPVGVKKQERNAEVGATFPGVGNGRFYLLSEKKKGKKFLTFAFCSPIVRSGRGNGKRAAFGSIAIFGSHELGAAR
jgi:hypothetical protein